MNKRAFRIAGVLALLSMLSCVAHAWRRHHQRETVIARVIALRGQISTSQSRLRDELQKLGLNTRIGQLYRIQVANTPVTEADLEVIGTLNELTELSLDATNITDSGLKQLRRLTELQSLRLSNNRLAGAGLQELSQFDRLQILDLSHTDVTDENLAFLTELDELEVLDLSGTPITRDALIQLRPLTRLRRLTLEDTEISIDDFRRIQDIGRTTMKDAKRKLTRIDLSDRNATEEVLQNVRRRLPHLDFRLVDHSGTVSTPGEN